MTLKQNPVSHSALIVIDVQDSFKKDAFEWDRRSNPHFEKNIEALIAAFRSARLPIVYFLHTGPYEGFRANDPECRLMDFLHPLGDETLLYKSTRSCFGNADLQRLLVKKGIQRLVITGIQTEQCCETTARDGADLGYDIDFIVDATSTFPIANLEDPTRELDVQAIEERTIYVLNGRFAHVCKTEDFLKGGRVLSGGEI